MSDFATFDWPGKQLLADIPSEHSACNGARHHKLIALLLEQVELSARVGELLIEFALLGGEAIGFDWVRIAHRAVGLCGPHRSELLLHGFELAIDAFEFEFERRIAHPHERRARLYVGSMFDQDFIDDTTPWCEHIAPHGRLHDARRVNIEIAGN